MHMENTTQGAAKMTADFHFEIHDGRGTATVWTVTRKKYAADIVGEYVGTVYGVHTVDEAVAAWKAEQA